MVPNAGNQEVAVYHVEYEPGGINPRHFHPAAVTFHIIAVTSAVSRSARVPRV